MVTKPSLAALHLLNRFGIDDPTIVPLSVIAFGIGAFYEEKSLKNCDGRIVSLGNESKITINSDIPYEGKKRFAAAHEIGHFELHRDKIPILTDTEENFVKWLQEGSHESEANEFASELLMPRTLFAQECKREKLSPQLIRELSIRFQTSLIATMIRFVEFGNHECCLVYCKNNQMKWWRKSKDFYPFLSFKRGVPPPTGSVAYEIFTKRTFYTDSDLKQQIWKSDWFQMTDDKDVPFFEYCVFVPNYNYTLSLIWEENKKSNW